MKRRRLVITGVLLLLGGAIVNVAVAWGCAIRQDEFTAPRKRLLGFTQRNDLKWVVSVDEGLGWTIVVSQAFVDLGVDRKRYVIPAEQVLPHWCPRLHPNDDWLDSEFYAYGIPMRSSMFVNDWANSTVIGSWTTDLFNAFRTKRSISHSEFLPLIPLWPGFAINTIFYAAMLWAVFFVPGMVRRRIRRRRGLCPACAYPIGTSPVCTECGAAVRLANSLRGLTQNRAS